MSDSRAFTSGCYCYCCCCCCCCCERHPTPMASIDGPPLTGRNYRKLRTTHAPNRSKVDPFFLGRLRPEVTKPKMKPDMKLRDTWRDTVETSTTAFRIPRLNRQRLWVGVTVTMQYAALRVAKPHTYTSHAEDCSVLTIVTMQIIRTKKLGLAHYAVKDSWTNRKGKN
jgi:hypothetical protein